MVALFVLIDVHLYAHSLCASGAPGWTYKALLKELIHGLAETEHFTERIVTHNCAHICTSFDNSGLPRTNANQYVPPDKEVREALFALISFLNYCYSYF